MNNGPNYVVLEIGGKIKKAIRATRLDATAIRGALQAMYPGQTILSPLERPTGPIVVVTVYMSRERNGIGRLSELQQWGVQ